MPASKAEYTMLVRSNCKDRAAVLEFELRGSKYRARAAYELDEGQLHPKLGNQQGGSPFPRMPGSDQSKLKPRPGLAAPPSDRVSVDSDSSVDQTPKSSVTPAGGEQPEITELQSAPDSSVEQDELRRQLSDLHDYAITSKRGSGALAALGDGGRPRSARSQ